MTVPDSLLASRGAGAGATLWLTGLPAAGKTTLARALQARLRTTGSCAVVLDGDELRHGLCADLAFSRADRAENARRTAHVAALVAGAGGVALVALVSPYRSDRAAARALHDEHGLRFVEVWCNRPLADCERDDPKGLYARARAGTLPGLTGVDDAYEPPRAPELELHPGRESVQRSVQRALDLLVVERGGDRAGA